MTSTQSQPSTILIIDDALENRILLTTQLQSDEYRIINAESGKEGIAVARSYQPDIIILDVMMPNMSGFEVVKLLKGDPVTAGIPIIMVTALRDVSYRIQGIAAGADEFLSRPHNREELLVRVKSLVQLKRARQNLEDERNHLRLLYNVSQVTMTHMELNQIITNILSYTQEVVGANKGMIMVMTPAGEVTHKILVRANEGTRLAEGVTRKVMNEGFAGWLWRHKQPAMIKDTSKDDRWIELDDDADPAGSVIGLPLSKVDGDVMGLIILSHSKPNYFDEQQLELLATIGGQVTAALHNARLFAEVSEERRKLSTILEQSNDIIITTDESNKILLFNAAAVAIFGIDEQEAIGQHVCQLEALKPFRKLFASVTTEPVTDEIGLNTGPILSASVTPIPNVGLIAVMQDVTERKLAEARQLELERREKVALRDALSRYISPSLLEHALADTEGILERRKRRAVVLFADLRNHTEMLVNLSANDALNLLNDFFKKMTEIVHHYEGTIFDLIGDELEIGFNVPIDQPDAAERALKTAIEMQRRFDEMRPIWFEKYATELGLGIGINQGDVVIGNVGSSKRMNLALVGEAVNTAHRMVELAEDGQIIVPSGFYESVEAELAFHQVDFKSLGYLKIKGIQQLHEIYRADMPRTPILPIPSSSFAKKPESAPVHR